MTESRTRRTPPEQSGAIYQLRVTLPGLPVWRRLLVRGDASLALLHAVLQVAMGWTNSHLHQFIMGKLIFSDQKQDAGLDFGLPPDLDEGKATLMEVAPKVKAKLVYEYDFGDSWGHVILVEKILAPDTACRGLAECIDGACAGPPEDCGGAGGYLDLLEIIRNPGHKERGSIMEWLGGEFDPEAFDMEKVNKYLRKLKWPRTTQHHLAKVLMERDGWGL